MILKERILADLAGRVFPEGSTSDLARHYGVKTATAYRVMRAISDDHWNQMKEGTATYPVLVWFAADADDADAHWQSAEEGEH